MPGDRLSRDLRHPESTQMLLPAGTVLNSGYIAKIRMLGLEKNAVICVDPPARRESGEVYRKFLESEVFAASKDVAIRLENLARAFGAQSAVDVAASDGIRRRVSEVIGRLFEQLRSLPPGSFAGFTEADYFRYSHPFNTAALTMAVGIALDFDDRMIPSLGEAAFLADAGMFRLPKELLHKQGELTPSDLEVLRTHVALGAEFLSGFSWAKGRILQVANNHHERYNGSGYPLGLKGGEVGAESLIVGLADAYDTMISDQPFRPRLDPAIAYRLVLAQAGKEWPKALIGAFRQYVVPYPVGSMLRLSNGAEGRVLAINPEILTRPVVQVGQREVDLSREREVRVLGVLRPRRHYRMKMALPISIRMRGCQFNGFLKDLSLGGLSIVDTEMGAPPGTQVDMSLSLPDSRVSLEITGIVVWARRGTDDRHQIGVTFTRVTTPNRDRLLDALWDMRI